MSCNKTTENPENVAEKSYAGILKTDVESIPTDADHVKNRLATYAPFTLTTDLSHLSENDR